MLLGATGYIGQAFARELRRRGRCFIPLSRNAFDYTRFELLFDYIRKIRPEFLVNAAGFTGRPNVDACEVNRMETFQANTLLPQTVARACAMTNTPWGQVSSGCIYTGAKVFEEGEMRVERNLNRPEIRELFECQREKFFGFTEHDEPNFSFRSPPCNFQVGTKALAEEALRGAPQTYVWRPRMPFNEWDDPCNLLSKLLAYQKIYDHVTSLSHLDDFAKACLDLVDFRAPYGVYNVTNPGAVTTRQIAGMIQRLLAPDRHFQFWESDEEFYREGVRAPRSSSMLDVSKLLRTGVKMRPIEDALEEALTRWHPATSPRRRVPFEPLPVPG
jgi:UDP-glucose 4,6-dehydratase